MGNKELVRIGNSSDLKPRNYSCLINDRIHSHKEFRYEKDFRKWFKDNYPIFDFWEILEDNKYKTPDFVCLKDGEPINIELETKSSHFFDHKHNKEEIDLVICLEKNKELPVETIEIKNFSYKEKHKGTISIDEDIWVESKKIAISRDESLSGEIEKFLSFYKETGDFQQSLENYKEEKEIEGRKECIQEIFDTIYMGSGKKFKISDLNDARKKLGLDLGDIKNLSSLIQVHFFGREVGKSEEDLWRDCPDIFTDNFGSLFEECLS